MILGISGSPREDGITANAVKKILEDCGKEYEYISLAKKRINGCISCLKCASTNKCVVGDDFIDIGEKMKKADFIIMGIPNYYNNMNAISHALFERCFCFRHTGIFELEGKPVVLFSTSYSTNIENNQVLRGACGFIHHNKMNLIHQFSIAGYSQCFTCPEGIGCKVGNVFAAYGDIKTLTDEMYPPKFHENKRSLAEVENAVKIIKKHLATQNIIFNIDVD